MGSIQNCSKTRNDVCAVKRAQEKKLDVVEMRTLRWMCVYSYKVDQNKKDII